MGGAERYILLACYGGGHVQSLIPIARGLVKDNRIRLRTVGFTTARAAFERAGIKAEGYSIFEQYVPAAINKVADPFWKGISHPDVRIEDTRAYFRVGMYDLVEEIGEQAARERVAAKGRAAFQPEMTLARFLERERPDLVITSTSPRSELALQRAARRAGITGLAVSDLFLQHESCYLCSPGYARDLTVIARYVADFLRQSGCTGHRLHVTGNPAFDRLFQPQAREEGRRIRRALGLNSGEILITWVGAGSTISLPGKRFHDNAEVLTWLEWFCRRHPGFRYAFRPHPNRPARLPEECLTGACLGAAYSVEGVLWASDVVLLEASTAGFQAALIGRPVVTIGAGNYPPYAELGLAVDVPDLESAGEALLERRPPDLERLAPQGLGDAANRVLQVVYDLLELEAMGA